MTKEEEVRERRGLRAQRSSALVPRHISLSPFAVEEDRYILHSHSRRPSKVPDRRTSSGAGGIRLERCAASQQEQGCQGSKASKSASLSPLLRLSFACDKAPPPSHVPGRPFLAQHERTHHLPLQRAYSHNIPCLLLVSDKSYLPPSPWSPLLPRLVLDRVQLTTPIYDR